MKQTLTLFAALVLLAVGATAQKLSYSAVVRNSENQLMANETLTLEIGIANSEDGAAVYTETRSVTTSQNGLLSLTIGDGTALSTNGAMADVNWPTAYITTKYTIDGEQVINKVPVTAVPYALYSESVSGDALVAAVNSMTDDQRNALRDALNQGNQAPAPISCGTMTDASGNTYETVQIGTQCWIKTNLRTTKYRNGGTIQENYTGGQSLGSYYHPTAEQVPGYTVETYGYYYNGDAVEGDTLCPTGWHVPSDADWTQLTEYLRSYQGTSGEYAYRCDQYSEYWTAKSLASKTGWESSTQDCAIGNNPEDNDATGFSAIPAGSGYSQSLLYDAYGKGAYFWSSTSEVVRNRRCLFYTDVAINSYYSTNMSKYSVRCLKDETSGGGDDQSSVTGSCPTITVTDILPNANGYTFTAMIELNGNTLNDEAEAFFMTYDGADSAIYCQIYAEQIDPAPLSGTASVTVNVPFTGSNPTGSYDFTFSTSLKVRAYLAAPGACDHVVGSESYIYTVPVTTPEFPNCGTMTDGSGNTYETVQIDNQCWTRTNLRATKDANGNPITVATSAKSDEVPYCYEISGVNTDDYGYHYNWAAANLVCPAGWHLPTDAEWTAMEATLTNQNVTDIDFRGDHAGKLSCGNDWTPSSEEAAPGNLSYVDRNSTGFSVVPSGYHFNIFQNVGDGANFWTSTGNNTNNGIAWERELNYDKVGVKRGSLDKRVGISVRCVKGDAPSGEDTPAVECPSVGLNGNDFVLQKDEANNVYHAQFSYNPGTVNPWVAATYSINNAGENEAEEYLTVDENSISISIPGSVAVLNNGDLLNVKITVYVSVDFPACTTNIYIGHYQAPQSSTTNCGIMTDALGNQYETVVIGSQCWTKSNLRYAVGTSGDAAMAISADEPMYYEVPDQDVTTYGYIYNWPAALQVCPSGWHLPTKAEFDDLANYLDTCKNANGDYLYRCDQTAGYIAKSLASTHDWNEYTNASHPCAVGNNQSANNASGFGAVPAGGSYYTNSNFGIGAYFWTSTQNENDPNTAWYSYVVFSKEILRYHNSTKNYGRSVRCLKNEGSGGNGGETPSMECPSVGLSGLNFELQKVGGSYHTEFSYTPGSGTSVTAMYDINNGAVQSANQYLMVGENSISLDIPEADVNLCPSCTLKVQISVTPQMQACTARIYEGRYIDLSLPCEPLTVNNVTYTTKRYGSQCWMTQNLRVKLANATDGTNMANNVSTTSPFYYIDTVANEYFYNWPAAIEACPSGWHLPTDGEWLDFVNCLGNYQDEQGNYIYRCWSSNKTTVAKALASTTGWNQNDDSCAVGGDPDNNNKSDFGALPVGFFSGNYSASNQSIGGGAYFWTASETTLNTTAWSRSLYPNLNYVSRGTDNKSRGYSVRCVKDE